MFRWVRWPDAPGAYVVDQLAAIGARPSVSRTGCYYDNAPMETFCHTLNVEFVHQRQWA
jgi:putative transposase